MDIQTFRKKTQFVQAAQFDGTVEVGRELAKWVGEGGSFFAESTTERASVQVPTLFGPRDIHESEWVVKFFDDEGDAFKVLPYKDGAFHDEFALVRDESNSNLMQHTRREMELLGEEETTIQSTLEIVRTFSEMGHSGASAAYYSRMLYDLLGFRNLKPLTNNPEEWKEIDEELAGSLHPLWQNIRNPASFSHNGGISYWMSNEETDELGERVTHFSEDVLLKDEADASSSGL